MNNLFYPRMAVTNIKKNSKFYFPYFLTCISTVTMFYIMHMISINKGLSKMPGAGSLKTVMGFGTVVIGIFSTIFLFYTNSFLMKRRKKELGLYNILGMEKKHIAKILLLETMITAVGTITIGLLSGIVLSKLIFLILFKVINFSVPLNFFISTSSLVGTVLLFTGIFFVTLLWNLLQITMSKPIELLKGGNIGEREPKSKVLITIIGLITLGAGYFIALTTESPLDAIPLFFVAVVLVIIGTYCLFTSGSIALLKMLRKNKNYYYKTKNFVSVSGMIYRMKQNAVGLANICILSTMVLVMLSTTVSLYIGVEEQLENRYPKDLAMTLYQPTEKEITLALQAVKDTVDRNHMPINNLLDYRYLSFVAKKVGDTFITDREANSMDNLQKLFFITEDEYTRVTGEEIHLSENEVLIHSSNGKMSDHFNLFNKEYRILQHLSSFPLRGEYTSIVLNIHYIVVKDQATLNEIYENQLEAYSDRASEYQYYLSFDMEGEKEEKIDIYREVVQELREIEDVAFSIENRQSMEDEIYVFYGGFLFLGLFLGTLFLMATVLIIYYKQISEGYDDKDRFEIMQKVGMSLEEVKNSVKSQIIKVFFLPLMMAIIHIIAAFKMITKLLAVMNLTNIPLFMICTVATILIFGLIYGVVYSLTAKVYYRIVS